MIKVLIAEDMTSIRNKYEKQLSQFSDIEIVGTAKNGYEAISETALKHPDIVLMDIEMESKYSGILATQQITSSFPDIKVIMLTVASNDDAVFSAFQAGASNYIFKNSPIKQIAKTIQEVYNGKTIFDESIANKIIKEFKRIKNNEDVLLSTISLIQQLTETERTIIYNYHQGYSQQELCNKLCIEKTTMKTHIRNILKKLECRTIEEAIHNIEDSGYFYYYERLTNTIDNTHLQ